MVKPIVLSLAVALGVCQPVAFAQDCSSRPYCTEMRSCAEADFYFRQCGHGERDADHDGIPCENLCGDSMSLYLARRAVGGGGLGLMSKPTPDVTCGSKRRCGQMLSCDEAMAYLTQCGVSSLDRDGDGVPCESLCR